jgi:hypothetical protein
MRAASIRVDSCPSLVVNLDEALRPPLLRVMQNTGHCILSPLKKRVSAGHPYPAFAIMVIYLCRSL